MWRLRGKGIATNPRKPFPSVGLAYSLISVACFLPICVMVLGGHASWKGLLVSLPRKGIPPASILSGPSAPLVAIDGRDQLYLNYKRTSWEQLPAELHRALRSLPVRVVYFDADVQIPFMDAARAIDTIVSLDAKPILLTPNSKAENRESPDSAPSQSKRIF